MPYNEPSPQQVAPYQGVPGQVRPRMAPDGSIVSPPPPLPDSRFMGPGVQLPNAPWHQPKPVPLDGRMNFTMDNPLIQALYG